MSEAKRFTPNYTENGRYLNMIEHPLGEYVSAEDFYLCMRTVVAFAEAVIMLGKHKIFKFCLVCGKRGEEGHSEACIVGLAEELLKETPNER